MDVVVRTPHGDGDVTIVAVPANATLGDLVGTVTGQATPTTARVDGRLLSISTQLSDAGVVVGSLIDTRLEATQRPADNDHVLHLTQLAGRGAGSVIGLSPGRYRIGSARRIHAPELDGAPVETGAFELTVSAGSFPRVTPVNIADMVGGPYAAALGHHQFDTEVEWSSGNLNVGGRVFQIAAPGSAPIRREFGVASADGTVAFLRSTDAPPSERPLAVGARRDAEAASGSLWQRRRNDPDAFSVPFGMHRNGVTTTTVDLQRNRGVAVVGSERFTSAMARTVLVELATLHGPADVDIAIATTPGRLPAWSWARWLPHLRRGGPDSPPELFCEPAELTSLAHALLGTGGAPIAPRQLPPPGAPPWQPPSTSSAEPRLSLLVIDDLGLWARRDSPLRSVITNPPPELRVLVLCNEMNEAPGLCTALIEEIAPTRALERSGARQHSSGESTLLGSLADLHVRLGASPQVISDIRPALVETDLASDIARALAPLDDIDAHRTAPPPTRLAGPSLAELVSTVDPAAPRHAAAPLNAPIGVLAPGSGTTPVGRSPVSTDLTLPGPTWLITRDAEHHDAAIAAITLAAAAQRSADELAILVIGRERRDWHSELPHLAGWSSHAEAADPSRLVHRVAHVLNERPGLDVLVVVEHAPATNALVAGMTELAASLPRVHLVLTGTDAEHDDALRLAQHHPTVWIGSDGNGTVTERGNITSFIGVTAESAETAHTTVIALASELIVRPAALGRPMTPLERRLARTAAPPTQPADSQRSAAVAVARHVVHGRADAPANPSLALLPPPLPDEIAQSLLLERHPGDGVPLGLVDRPERASSDVYWWQPGSGGSILALGSPRSGMTTMLDLLITGIAARVSADDLHVYAIEALPQRRRGLAALPHAGNVIAPDESTTVIGLIAQMHARLTQRIAARRHDDLPDLLLMIGDVGRVKRALPADAVDTAFRQLGDIAATGAAVGINIVAVAGRTDDLGNISRLTGDKLIGAVADSEDRIRLGAPGSVPADRHTGRCWSTNVDRRVQLATPADSLELEIAVIAPEPARLRAADDLTIGHPA